MQISVISRMYCINLVFIAVIICYCCSCTNVVNIILQYCRTKWSFTLRDKHVAENTQSSQNKCSRLIQPSTYFVQGDEDKYFCRDFNCSIDELCKKNVHTKSIDIQADSVVSTGHTKPTNRNRRMCQRLHIYYRRY